MHLARFPRVKLCHAPTPLEFMPNLTKALGGPQLWIKRDDCTGVAMGGNKNRKLEYLMGEALAQGATHIVTQGALQSNHVRQTAAVCAKLGLKCTALLEHRVDTNSVEYLEGGNVLLLRSQPAIHPVHRGYRFRAPIGAVEFRAHAPRQRWPLA